MPWKRETRNCSVDVGCGLDWRRVGIHQVHAWSCLIFLQHGLSCLAVNQILFIHTMLGEQDSPSQSQSLGASSFDFTQDDTLLGVNDFSSIRIDHADTVANLTQAWINERNAPELLPYKRYLVEPLLKAIEDQVSFLVTKVSLFLVLRLSNIDRDDHGYHGQSSAQVYIHAISKRDWTYQVCCSKLFADTIIQGIGWDVLYQGNHIDWFEIDWKVHIRNPSKS